MLSYLIFRAGTYWSKGPSIKYVTLFLVNFNPPPSVTLCHTSRDPPKYVTHLGPTPIFSRPSTKISDKSSLYKFSLSCSRGVCPGVFSWGLLSGVVFVRSPFSHKTSVTRES